MKLLPYREKDAEYIVTWMKEERKHYKWCAGLLPYPLTKEAFHERLLIYQRERDQLHFTAVTDEGKPVGFFFMSPEYDVQQAYMGFVIIDSNSRGLGYGRKMMQLAFTYCFTVLNMNSVQLRVYKNNEQALKMYMAAGMQVKEYIPKAFDYQGEKWDAYVMQMTRESFTACLN